MDFLWSHESKILFSSVKNDEILCPALRLAVASAQGAAGLSSVPVAPPGRQSSPHFCARAPRRPEKCIFNFAYDFKFVSFLNYQDELGLELAVGIECEMEK